MRPRPKILTTAAAPTAKYTTVATIGMPIACPSWSTGLTPNETKPQLRPPAKSRTSAVICSGVMFLAIKYSDYGGL